MKNLILTTFLVFTSIAAFGQTANRYNQIGDGYWEKGDYKQAIENYTKAINLSKQALFYFNRGYSYQLLSEYADAVADYTKAIQLNPNYAEAYHNRGFVKDYQREYEGAIADFTKAIAMSPQYADAYNNRGFTKSRLKDYEGAIADYSKAIKIKTNFADAYNNRGYAKAQLKEYKAAILDYDKALQYDKNFAAAYNNRGCSKHEISELESALSDFNRAIQLNAKNASYYDNRGTTKYYLNLFEEAVKDYDTALRLNPNMEEVYYNRGTVKEKMDLDEEALKDFNKMLSFQPFHQPSIDKVDYLKQKKKNKENPSFENNLTVRTSTQITKPAEIDFKMTWNTTDFELFNLQTVNSESITARIIIDKENLELSKFQVIVNGYIQVCDTASNHLDGDVLTVKICLQVGQNNVFVSYGKGHTQMLNLNYRLKRTDFYLIAAGVKTDKNPCGNAKAKMFESQFEKGQWGLYSERSIQLLNDEKTTAKKIKNDCSYLNTGYRNVNVKSENDVVIFYISSSATLSNENNELLIKGAGATADNLNKTTFTLDDLFDRMNNVRCRKAIFLDIVLEETLTLSEIQTIQKNLENKATENGWLLFAALSSDVDCGNNGFTSKLVTGLNNNADKNRDKIISIRELSIFINEFFPNEFPTIIDEKLNFNIKIRE